MADINTNLTDLTNNANRLAVATSAIANAIVAKGGTVASGDGLEDFPANITTIPTADDSGHFIKEALPIKFTGDGNNLTDYTIYGKQGGLNGVCPNVYPTIDSNSINRSYWGEWYTWERYLPDEPAYNTFRQNIGLGNEIYVDVGTWTFSVYMKAESQLTDSARFIISEASDFPHYSQRATVSATTKNISTVPATYQRFTFTFNVTEAGYICPRIEKLDDSGNNIIVTCYQLESGSTASPYIAYGTTGITINVNGANIFFPLDTPLGPDDTLTMTDTGVSIATVNGLNTITTPIVGGFDMKIKGGISSLTLGTKVIKDNGEYEALTDSVAGYSSIEVDVPARGYNHGGVNFFDVDGTILYSYTSEEFLALTEMPPNPDRSWDWLTAQGWNWTLSDAKTYVTNYGALNIGQHYITIDNKTAIHVLLPDGCLNPQLGLYLSGTVDIDWGDETAHETLTGSSSSYQYTTHTYAEPGRYYILITVTSGTAIMKGGNSANKLFCKGGLGNTTPSNESKKYTNCIQDIHIGANMDIGTYAFYRCYSMKHISIPSTVRSINNSTFQWNSSLQAVVIPEGVTALGTSTFEGCYGLRFVSTPKSLTSVGQKCFSQCYSVIALTFSNSLTSVDQKCFVDCPSCDVLQTPGISGTIPLEFCARNRTMMDFVIPEGVTAIGQDAFTYCYGLMNVTVPSTLRTTGTNAFSYCQALNTITFPDEFTTMAASTFESCSALQSFTIPSGMTEIPQKAFKSCASLSHIRIPWTITTIGTEAFSTCSGLAYIQFEGSIPPTLTNSNTFASLETDCIIFVPQDRYSTYTSASYYPSPSTYTYCIFETYTSGRELPNMISSDKTYDLTWYASQNDAISQTNPITEGNGKEVYARVVERV